MSPTSHKHRSFFGRIPSAQSLLSYGALLENKDKKKSALGTPHCSVRVAGSINMVGQRPQYRAEHLDIDSFGESPAEHPAAFFALRQTDRTDNISEKRPELARGRL